MAKLVPRKPRSETFERAWNATNHLIMQTNQAARVNQRRNRTEFRLTSGLESIFTVLPAALSLELCELRKGFD